MTERNKDKDPGDERVDRLLKIGGVIGAVGVVLAVGGNIVTRIDRDGYVSVAGHEREALLALNQQLLTDIARLPFDVNGHAQRRVDDTKKPGFSNNLTVQMGVDGDTFVITGQGQHKGFTPRSHTPFDDPSSFRLVYSLPPNTHMVPPEMLKNVMSSGQMPKQVSYRLSEERPTPYGRTDTNTRIKELDLGMTELPNGNLGIQKGKNGLMALTEDRVEDAQEVYGRISSEVERVR